jgi:hypothetical protein
MQRSLWTSFIAIYLMILRLFSHRIYRKKWIVSTGDTGGPPAGTGENPVIKSGRRSQDGCHITSVRERSKTTA